ncbi:START domain-containing protein [Halobacteriovorax marinus]|uniref:START domain-containing protein n=1 Tax=Halobacteriovorax marinus TaxID=97084 RepID=UPI003A931D87
MNKLVLAFSLILSLTTSANINWTPIHTEDNINIFTREAEEGILPFRATGTIKAPLKVVLETLMDMSNKNKWSPKLKSVNIHKTVNENHMIISEYYKTPWPATDREFLLEGIKEKISDTKYIIRAKSVVNQDYSSTEHIQADVKYLDVTLEYKNKNETKIDFRFHGDLKGWMPIWLTNLIQKKWPLRFIQGLNKYISSRDTTRLSLN